ncbi:type III-B CRISPR-associated protein Cas10/Cmr2 [Myxococcota bacterium]|nr:type III-B CRISPR-associated protein Cas10/Cmr2 [Myxococcota bacterium]MCZ7620395.1 type III-B CRISPR-associated protein Cas10/Cmr2 [Myxococcota bacterium]
MTAHLLLVTLGPVQDFIAQARRTRDLWYGSHLLSELGRAAARALVDGAAKLIFPSLQTGDAQLAECLAPLRADGAPPQNIANKLLAEVPDGVDPQQLARGARKAVADYWRDQLAAPVRTKCAGLLANDIDAVWTEQIDTFLEFAASWLPLGDYAQTRRQLEQAIAARKLLRDFDPWTQGRGNVPKSSLDGARESVLLPPRQRASEPIRRYRVADGEQLDAVGLVKRAGGEPDQFVPVINVALASWLERASRGAPSELDALKQACSNAGVSRVARTDLPCVQPFAFDGSVLFPNRWRSVFDEHRFQADSDAWGGQHVRPLFRKLPEPYPYVACLVADGDRMGRAIDGLGSADAHRAFSKALAGFAGATRKVVEQQHRGVLVYAGGDDVLAFVSLPEALGCADDLRKAFESAMATACASLTADQHPTLSIGLGIGHVMESMGHLLTFGRQAEREAKRDRNALAILVDKRSGGTRTWSAQWGTEPVRLLNKAAALLRDRIPSRKVYEIASILSRLPKPDNASDDGWARVLALEVKRALSRGEGAGLRPEEVGLALDPKTGYGTLHASVEAWVALLLIARTFDRATIRERRSHGAAA